MFFISSCVVIILSCLELKMEKLSMSQSSSNSHQQQPPPSESNPTPTSSALETKGTKKQKPNKTRSQVWDHFEKILNNDGRSLR